MQGYVVDSNTQNVIDLANEILELANILFWPCCFIALGSAGFGPAFEWQIRPETACLIYEIGGKVIVHAC